MESFCLANKISLAHPLRVADVYKVGQNVAIQGPAHVERYSTLTPGSFFSIGAFSFSFSSFPAGTVIGRYCSIGGRVEAMSWQHPTQRFTSSPITYLPRWQQIARADFGCDWHVLPWNELAAPPEIGHDVWIGDGVLIKRGVRIGTGSIIAARSIVTEDVPDYAIVAGSPARIAKLRFPQKTVARLLKTQWWRFRYVDLPNERLDDVGYFLDELEARMEKQEIEPWTPAAFDIGVEFQRISVQGARLAAP